MFVIISYDIADDKRRRKIHKALKSFGQRIQFSVFECELSPMDYLRLRERLELLIEKEEDNIRFYRLCEKCQDTCERIGGPEPLDEYLLYCG